MKSAESRSSNIELLRIVLILMVITSHFNFTGMGGALSSIEEAPFNRFPLMFLGSMSVCAVNCFMIISGYFLAGNRTIRLSKVLDLLILVVFYRFLCFGISVLTGKEAFSASELVLCLIPVNYFAIFYLICYLFSPFQSTLNNSLSAKNQGLYTGIVLLLFVLYPTVLDAAQDLTGRDMTIISSIASSGNSAGYSIIQFMTMLILGMYIRNASVSVPKRITLSVFLVCSLVMTFGVSSIPSLYNYCSVFTVINAVCLFLFFNQLSIKNSRLINTVSKSVFGIFLFHTGSVTAALWKEYIISRIPLNHSVFMTLLCWLFSVFSLFIICLAVDLLRRLLFGKIKGMLLNRLPVIRIPEN